MNISDSERISSFLEKEGFALASEMELSDLVIFNTCGIRQTAENRAYSIINNLRKKRGSGVRIILTGCLANRPDVQKRMRSKVDFFCSIKDFPEKVSSIKKKLNTRYEIRDTKNNFQKEAINYLSINPKHINQHQAYVPIMTGCNNFCSYCVVPYARGREVSRPTKEIISEIKSLIQAGYKQITLLGQNVNSYSYKVYKVRKVEKMIGFAELLEMIDKIPGKFWIQFVSSHPKDMTPELIETVTKLKKVCEWIHLPLQAGDDEILARMNRKYTSKHYLNLIKQIKANFKKNKPTLPFSISSDIIVGFPGETRAQFANSAEIMRKANFDMVFFGQFSPRPNTAAWTMKDNVSQQEKARREKFLNEILKKTAFENNQKYIGTIQEMLIEKLETKAPTEDLSSKQKSFVYFGKTRTQKNVRISSPKKLTIGAFIKAKITKANIWNLEAEIK